MTRCLAIFGLLLMCPSVADAGLTQVLLQRQRAADLRLLGARLVTADGHARYRAQPEVPAPAGVHVTYLGTGGLLIERNGAAILSAPYFANNSLFRVGLSLTADPFKVTFQATRGVDLLFLRQKGTIAGSSSRTSTDNEWGWRLAIRATYEPVPRWGIDLRWLRRGRVQPRVAGARYDLSGWQVSAGLAHFIR